MVKECREQRLRIDMQMVLAHVSNIVVYSSIAQQNKKSSSPVIRVSTPDIATKHWVTKGNASKNQ